MYTRPAVVLFTVAFLVRLGVGLSLLAHAGIPEAFPSYSDDGDAYDAAARFVAWGTPIDHVRFGAKWPGVAPDPAARWPSAYWLLLAGLYRVFGVTTAFPPLLVLQAALGALGTVAGYCVARRLAGSVVAATAGVLLACSSTLVLTSAALYAEALYVPLLLIGVWLAVESAATRPRARRLGLALASGASLGLAEATRPLALPVLLVVAGWLALAAPGRDVVAGRWTRGAPGLAVLAGAALALAPFVMRDLAVLGRVAVFSAGGAEAFHDRGLGEQLSALGVDPYQSGLQGALSAAAAQPWEVLTAIASALPERLAVLFLVGGWGPIGEPLLQWLGPMGVLVRVLILTAAVCGVVASFHFQARQPLAALLAATALALLVPSLLLGLPLVRYRVPADPILLTWLAVGLASIGRRALHVARVHTVPVT